MPTSRLRLIVVLLVAAPLVGYSAASASASESPSVVLRTVLSAANSEDSVHYESLASAPGASVGDVGDAGVQDGVQRITYRKNGRVGHVTIVVAAGGAYIRGDRFGLTAYLSLKAAGAAKYANVWVLVPRSNKDYARFAAAVTLPATTPVPGVVAELVLDPPLSLTTTTKIDGATAQGIRGRPLGAKFTATLYATTTGARLPIEEVGHKGKDSFSIKLSAWGKPLHIAAPPHATPIAKTALQ